ncbi:MAG: CBS domain-containing protein [Candidatus Aenigmarchaeota archaeon]|nr:CBS domain-containing protein [Candidatus Aenigmarchaeota archaeon]
MVKVREVMKKHVITADLDTNMYVISKTMTNNRIGSVIFLRDGSPVDIVTTDDIVSMVASGRDPKKTKIKDIRKKRKELITVSPEDNILAIAKKMIKLGVKRFPVVEKRKLVGIISEKEILIVSPELIEILSEKLKEKVESVPDFDSTEMSGLCEFCEQYSDELQNINGRWICPECRNGNN